MKCGGAQLHAAEIVTSTSSPGSTLSLKNKDTLETSQTASQIFSVDQGYARERVLHEPANMEKQYFPLERTCYPRGRSFTI
jgi:hypothetical protein